MNEVKSEEAQVTIGLRITPKGGEPYEVELTGTATITPKDQEAHDGSDTPGNDQE